MLLRLKLQNFQKHEDVELNFTGGLQVVRGKNEAGKSTLFRALAYAWWGSRALPESLEETVTWGKPVSSLKVTVVFLHNGVEYTAVRSKSGATLTSVLATSNGQAEVTAAMERLFGASAAVAQATLMAKQKALEDGLDSSAMTLIERLSNMSLLDELILKIQDKLPSGNTKVLESQIASLVVERPVLDEAPLLAAVLDEQGHIAQLIAQREQVQAEHEAAATLAGVATRKLEANKVVERERARLEAAAALCVQIPIEDELADLDDLRAQAEKQVSDTDIVRQYSLFLSATSHVTQRLQLPEVDVREQVMALEGRITELNSRINEFRTQQRVARASLILESACGLCGKDLSQVPEVQEKNARLEAQIASCETGCQACSEELAEVGTEVAELRSLLQQTQKQQAGLTGVKLVVLDSSTCPPTATWAGPEELPLLSKLNYTAVLRSAEAAHAKHAASIRANENAKAKKAVYDFELSKLQLQEVTAEEADALVSVFQLQVGAAQIARELEQFRIAERNAQHALSTAKAVHTTRLAAWEAAQLQKTTLEDLLVKTKFHNALIGRLREARPVVAKQLWSLVLAGVSHYFSRMRGVHSTVTRSTNGFLIDGKAVTAFSGSTKDCLGLANRVVLQKTFLPGLDFMLVDEPGAACDDAREADLLGMLASCGLEQVILVTHKDLADAFAANVIQV